MAEQHGWTGALLDDVETDARGIDVVVGGFGHASVDRIAEGLGQYDRIRLSPAI